MENLLVDPNPGSWPACIQPSDLFVGHLSNTIYNFLKTHTQLFAEPLTKNFCQSLNIQPFVEPLTNTFYHFLSTRSQLFTESLANAFYQFLSTRSPLFTESLANAFYRFFCTHAQSVAEPFGKAFYRSLSTHIQRFAEPLANDFYQSLSTQLFPKSLANDFCQFLSIHAQLFAESLADTLYQFLSTHAQPSADPFYQFTQGFDSEVPGSWTPQVQPFQSFDSYYPEPIPSLHDEQEVTLVSGDVGLMGREKDQQSRTFSDDEIASDSETELYHRAQLLKTRVQEERLDASGATRNLGRAELDAKITRHEETLRAAWVKELKGVDPAHLSQFSIEKLREVIRKARSGPIVVRSPEQQPHFGTLPDSRTDSPDLPHPDGFTLLHNEDRRRETRGPQAEAQDAFVETLRMEGIPWKVVKSAFKEVFQQDCSVDSLRLRLQRRVRGKGGSQKNTSGSKTKWDRVEAQDTFIETLRREGIPWKVVKSAFEEEFQQACSVGSLQMRLLRHVRSKRKGDR